MPSHRFGKHPPKHDYRTLRFTTYASKQLTAPPQSYDVLPEVYEKLKINNPSALFPMDGNDTWSDCTIAALAHAQTVYRGLLGRKKIMAEPAVEKLYFQLTAVLIADLTNLMS